MEPQTPEITRRPARLKTEASSDTILSNRTYPAEAFTVQFEVGTQFGGTVKTGLNKAVDRCTIIALSEHMLSITMEKMPNRTFLVPMTRVKVMEILAA